MTPYIWAIEGNLVLWVQQTFEAAWLTTALTHFYVAGFMFICYVSVFYFAYFDDRWLADRVTLSIDWVIEGYLAAEEELGPAPALQGGSVPSAKEVHTRLEDIRTRVRYHG